MAKKDPIEEPMLPEDPELEEAASLADLVGAGGQMFEGELISLAEIKGHKVLVCDFKFLPSSFRDGESYACISIKFRGEMRVVNTNASVLCKYFGNVDKANLPAAGTFIRRMSENKREYWDIE